MGGGAKRQCGRALLDNYLVPPPPAPAPAPPPARPPPRAAGTATPAGPTRSRRRRPAIDSHGGISELSCRNHGGASMLSCRNHGGTSVLSCRKQSWGRGRRRTLAARLAKVPTIASHFSAQRSAARARAMWCVSARSARPGRYVCARRGVARAPAPPPLPSKLLPLSDWS
jgi:hypothetical protein